MLIKVTIYNDLYLYLGLVDILFSSLIFGVSARQLQPLSNQGSQQSVVFRSCGSCSDVLHH